MGSETREMDSVLIGESSIGVSPSAGVIGLNTTLSDNSLKHS